MFCRAFGEILCRGFRGSLWRRRCRRHRVSPLRGQLLFRVGLREAEPPFRGWFGWKKI
jgi:hypothetical protein